MEGVVEVERHAARTVGLRQIGQAGDGRGRARHGDGAGGVAGGDLQPGTGFRQQRRGFLGRQGQGTGRRILIAAEEEALRRGCRYAWLDTFSFQARGFYEKLGYSVFGTLEDYPAGHSRYFLRKTLGEPGR